MPHSVDIQQAIDTYTPAWRPPPATLDGIVVIIEPLRIARENTDDPAFAEGALMSAAVLFHMIQQAGGVPQMTRADKGFAPASNPDVSSQDDAAPRIAIGIAFDTPDSVDDSSPTAVSTIASDNAGQLAAAISNAFDHAPIADTKIKLLTLDRRMPAITVAIGMDASVASNPNARRIPRKIAAHICRGIISFCSSNLEPTANQPVRHPSAAPPMPIPRFIDRPPEVELRSAARRVWPTGDLPIERATWFCDTFVRVNFSDRTFVYFEPRVAVEGDAVRVSGATNVALLRDTLADALRAVGVDRVESEMRVLPEAGTPGAERHGVCVSPMCLSYAEPSEASGMQSQLLYGEPVRVLDRDAGFLLVHGDDGYWGWVREANVRLLARAAYEDYIARPRAVFLRDVQHGNLRIVRGSTLPVADINSATVSLTDPISTAINVNTSDVYVPDYTTKATARVHAALGFMHVPYVYGGTSPIGLDCSGLAQQVCRRTGTLLPRDAARQFTSGRLVATQWDRANIEPGDLLYFINTTGRIFHVGIALNETHFVHSGPPEVKIDSLQESDRLYAPDRARTFLAARRLT